MNGSYSNKYQLGSADKIQTYSTQHMLTNFEANSAWWLNRARNKRALTKSGHSTVHANNIRLTHSARYLVFNTAIIMQC